MIKKYKITTALVPLAPGFEDLEAITITDLFVRAGISVTTAGLTDKTVTGSRGTSVIANTIIENIKNELFDLLVLPGGLPGADFLRDDKNMQAMIQNHAQHHKYVAAICAGPRALASAGILDNKTITAFPGSQKDSPLKHTRLLETAIEVDGNIITSRSPGTAIDFALQLIEISLGKNKRDEVAAQLVRD